MTAKQIQSIDATQPTNTHPPTMNTHTIKYEWPFGQRGPDEQAPRPDGECFASKAAAVAAIHAAVGDHGSYEALDGIECFHENDDCGCGSFAVVPL